jgi:hypothetical protein
MQVCEECSYPYKVLHRCKWELFHKRWILISGNCGKKLGGYITKHLNMEVTQIFLLGFLMLKKLAKIFG